MKDLAAPFEDQEHVFKEKFSPTLDFLKHLTGSFGFYKTFDMSNKSVDGQNCRKSAALSQMLLIHKVITLGEVKLTDE